MGEKIETKWIKWWNYISFWKVFGIGILAIILSFISAYFISSFWCLCLILPICGVAGYFIKKWVPDVLRDLMKELE